MSQKSNRGKRRGPARDGARPAAPAPATDRYQKFLPEWMRGNNAAAIPRPPRPRRARPARPAGGYTPGKFAVGRD
jgi:hypothetical protein